MGESREGREHPGAIAFLRLLQLASPALPVGAYSYSQALEHAVEAGAVRDEAGAQRWIEDVLRFTVAACEGRCLVAMLDALRERDGDRLAALNALFLASRESAELRAETVQLGFSAARLLEQLDLEPAVDTLRSIPEASYPCAWACAAHAFDLPRAQAHAAYLWAWLENQVLAAVKLVPLGQSAGQRILLRLGAVIAACPPPDAGGEHQWLNLAPGLALASVAHETQYTRLFRS